MFEWVMKTGGRIQPQHRAFHYGVLDHVQDELCVVVPFISQKAASDMVKRLQGQAQRNRRRIRVRFIAAGDAEAHLLGDGELEAVKYLLSLNGHSHNVAVEVRTVTRLHAKVYLSPGNQALVTSANLTVSGMRQNREAGFLVNDPESLQQIQRSFEELWAMATPVKIDQINKAIQVLERWRTEHSVGIHILEEIRKVVLFPPVSISSRDESLEKLIDGLIDKAGPVTAQSPIAARTSGTEADAPEPPNVPLVTIERVARGQLRIRQGRRPELVLELVELADEEWRLEIHRRGRPRRVVWSSHVRPSGRIRLSWADDELMVELYRPGQQVEVSRRVMPGPWQGNAWSATVHWSSDGELVSEEDNRGSTDTGVLPVSG